MRLIARENISGVSDDIGLYALDGIKEFEANVNTADELIDLFEKANPTFRAAWYEIINDI